MDSSNLGPCSDQSPHGSEKRRLVSDFVHASMHSDVPPIEDPLILQQVMGITDALGNQPITRRALLKLAALGGSIMLTSGVLPQVATNSCNVGLPFQSCTKIEDDEIKPDFSASVLRKEDMLALKFDFYNLRLKGANLERVSPSKDTYIVVNFAHGNDHLPQSIGEQAFLETAEEFSADTEDANNTPNPPGGSEALPQPGMVGARLSGPSRLAFKIPPGTSSIPFTLDELLSWEKYELSVAPTALPADETDAGREPTEPLWSETAIEVPWKLIMSPNRHAGWAHAPGVVTHDNRTELWHTRLGVRKEAQGSPGNYLVDEADDYYRTLRAIWTTGFDRDVTPDANILAPFRMSLTENDRWQLVRLTSDYNIAPPGIVSLYYQPKPVDAERFMLSSLGAWMDTRGQWPDAPAAADLDVIEWRHLAAMARDSYVRVVYKGFLFPVGHSATLVKVTERKFQAVPAGSNYAGKPAAYLRQRFFIVVRQPVKTYPAHSSQPNEGRGWPFESVRITTLVTPSLDNPMLHGDAYDLVGQGQKAFWPRVSGSDFLFHMVATDGDGQKTEFTAPLAFISSTLQQPGDVSTFLEKAVEAYNDSSANEARRKRPLEGQKVAFAPSSKKDGSPGGKPGDTSAEVKVFTLGATLPNPPSISLADTQARFFPIMQEAEVRLPAAEQVIGSALPKPVVIELHQGYLDKGFQPASNPSYVWAKLKTGVSLSFDGAGDKSGGVITPNIIIGGLSRSIGPVGGSVDTMPSTFNPADFFSGAMILGGLMLADIVQGAALGEGRKTPMLTNHVIYPGGNNLLPPEALETRLDWKPDVKRDPLGIFEPSSSTSMEVKGVFVTPIDPPGEPRYNIRGDLRDFWVNMIGDGKLLFLRLHFTKIIFTAETGKNGNVDVDIDKTEFAGSLSFVNPLRNFMKNFGKGMASDITPTQASVGIDLPIPSVAVGIVAIQNISLGVKLTIPFTGNPARVRFNFCERDQPFLLTVFAIGGGGYFAIEVGLDGVERIEAAFEFGATLALNIGVASGKIYVCGGIYFEMEKVGQPEETILLSAYIRMGGAMRVLGLVTLSVEFYLGLTFKNPPNELRGQAKLTVKVKVAFFSASVELSVERRIAGGDGGGSQLGWSGEGKAQALGSGEPGALKRSRLAGGSGIGGFQDLVSKDEWAEYASTFAGVPVK